MKFDCNKIKMLKEQRINKHSDWHIWFAWYPVKTEDGYFCWFEKVYRVGVGGWRSDITQTYAKWNYRTIE